MSKPYTDEFLVDPEAIRHLEDIERKEGLPLSKVEIIEYFFEWLRNQPKGKQYPFLLEVLRGE